MVALRVSNEHLGGQQQYHARHQSQHTIDEEEDDGRHSMSPEATSSSSSSSSSIITMTTRHRGDQHLYHAIDPATSPSTLHIGRMPVFQRRSTRFLLMLLGAAAILLGLLSSDSVQQIASRQGLLEYASKATGNLFSVGSSGHAPYFEPSASALPPALSNLPSSLKRITLIALWSGSSRPEYLNNFFTSAALNADVADLVVIHITDDQSECLDGKGGSTKDDGIRRDAAWDWEKGGNIRVVCLSREAMLQLKTDWLCSKDGWDCDKATKTKVLDRLHQRVDPISVEWKPMRGELYKQYFIHPENPIWGWTDMDMHLGRLDHIPFPLISTVAITTFSPFSPRLLFLPGQLTVFNPSAPGLTGAWKNYEPLSTAEAFLNPGTYAEGGYPEGAIDESYLSAAYLRGEEGFAGQGLSWMAVSDLHGQDIFIPGRKFVISGRNVLEVDSNLSREEIEAIVHDAETEAVDQHGGWSHAGQTLPTTMFKGTDCPTAWFDPAAAQCVHQNNLTTGDQYTEIDSVRRPTIVRLASDPIDVLQLRLEPDRRPRRWQRKLFMHYQEIKRQTWWWRLPPWFIGDEGEVMEFDWKTQQIWKMGPNRDETIWERTNDRLTEDGHSAHTAGVHLPGQPTESISKLKHPTRRSLEQEVQGSPSNATAAEGGVEVKRLQAESMQRKRTRIQKRQPIPAEQLRALRRSASLH